MRDVQRQTRTDIMALFQRHGINPRTNLGQNFLIDINLIEFIVRNGELTKQDVVLEVGTGTGGMTTFLSAEAGHVISVDVDPNMNLLARDVTSGCDNVTLVLQDILKNKNTLSPEVVDLVREELAARPDARLKLISNLPYSVATPVISNLVATDLPWSRMVVTIQLELGEKIVARPKSSDYGSLSVWLQSQCHVELLRRLPPTVFWPRPKVHSAIVRLEPDPKRAKQIANRAFLLDFVRRLFHQRRKLLRGLVRGMYRKQIDKATVDMIIEQMELKQNSRAEELPVQTLVELSNRLHAAITAAEALRS